jgi:hypothetical protein
MSIFKSALAAALFGFAAVSQAAVITIPVQGGMIEDAFGTGCHMTATGATVGGGQTCNVSIPMSLPAGTRVLQISAQYVANSANNGPFLGGALISVDSTMSQNVQFGFGAQPQNFGVLLSAPMMSQLGKTYPDAFFVQPDTMYHVDLHAEGDVTVRGLQIIYL